MGHPGLQIQRESAVREARRIVSKDKICGIYGIRNKKNGKVYVGQSVDIKQRFCTHRYSLRKNKHYNKHLQNSWNKNGESAFEFVILEKCTDKQLTVLEQKWIDSVENYFNKIDDVITCCGPANPFYGKKHTDKTKQRMSTARKGRYKGNENPNYGKKHSMETRIRMSVECSGKLTAENVLEIKGLLAKNDLSQQQIADRYGIGRTTVTRIASGNRWSNITGGAVSPEHVGSKEGKSHSQKHRERIGLGRLGKKHTEEAKEKIRQARLKERRDI